MRTDHIEDIITGLRDIIQKLENANADRLDLSRLESKITQVKHKEELKEKQGLKGFYFFKDLYYSGNYLCLTKDEVSLLANEDVTHLVLEDYELEQLLQGGYAQIKFPQTGKTYDNLNDLKHDLLTLKLSGVK